MGFSWRGVPFPRIASGFTEPKVSKVGVILTLGFWHNRIVGLQFIRKMRTTQ